MFEYICEQLRIKRHLVIVVAEGAGTGVRDAALLTKGVERDQSNNVKLPVYSHLFRISVSFLKLR